MTLPRSLTKELLMVSSLHFFNQLIGELSIYLCTLVEYIKEMERCRQTDKQEKSVQQFLDGQESKENGLVGILDNLNKRKDENVLYYSGGLRAIMSMCSDGMI